MKNNKRNNKAIVDNRLRPGARFKLVSLLPVFIAEQNLVGISAVLVVLYRHLGIYIMLHIAVMWKYDIIHKTFVVIKYTRFNYWILFWCSYPAEKVAVSRRQVSALELKSPPQVWLF